MKQLDKLMRQPPGYDRKQTDDGDVADKVKAAIREIRRVSGWGTVVISVKDGRPFAFSTKIDEKL